MPRPTSTEKPSTETLKRLRAQGWSVRDIAREYRVSTTKAHAWLKDAGLTGDKSDTTTPAA